MVIPARGISAAALAAALLAAAGCHGDQGTGAVDAGHVPDFSACDKTDAGPYTAGIVETSSTGLFTTTLVSVRTKPMITAPAVPFPTVGDSTFEVTFLQGGGPTPAGLTVTAEKPYMPLHGHGATVYPVVADDGGGAFTISNINFFMGGYWEVTLDLKFPAIVADAGSGTDAAADGPVDGPTDMDAAADAPSEADGGVAHVTPPTTDKVVIPICIPN